MTDSQGGLQRCLGRFQMTGAIGTGLFLAAHGGFLPQGVHGLALAFVFVIFSFFGGSGSPRRVLALVTR